MNKFFRSFHFKILAGLFVVIFAFTLRAAWTGGLSPLLEQIAGVVLSPIQKASAAVTGAVGGFFSHFLEADRIASEYQLLLEEHSRLRSQLVDYEQYKLENETLKEFLGIKEENPDFELELAAVIARGANDRAHSFTIDKGTLHGVAPRDPVLSKDGLVGVVSEVGANYATVSTILDPKLYVGAYDVRTRDTGTISGDLSLLGQNRCKLSYLPRESGAAAGDLVVTAGGGIFPRDLIIGVVEQVKDDDGGISLYAVVKPAADIPSITDVMVIKSFYGQELPEAEE